MDVNRAVSEFVSQGRDLHHLLRSDGESTGGGGVGSARRTVACTQN
jgi:hypothetical protein